VGTRTHPRRGCGPVGARAPRALGEEHSHSLTPIA
jgi:hypothetical protein